MPFSMTNWSKYCLSISFHNSKLSAFTCSISYDVSKDVGTELNNFVSISDIVYAHNVLKSNTDQAEKSCPMVYNTLGIFGATHPESVRT